MQRKQHDTYTRSNACRLSLSFNYYGMLLNQFSDSLGNDHYLIGIDLWQINGELITTQPGN